MDRKSISCILSVFFVLLLFFFNSIVHLSFWDPWISYLSRPAHTRFLEYGVDSLTIKTSLNINATKEYHSSHHTLLVEAGDFIQKVEHTVRALSNLHEKLHHSITQYLLVSSKKFISCTEYLLPVILMLMPLAIRAIELLFREIQPCFQTRVTSSVISIAWIGMVTLRLLLNSPLFITATAKKVVFSLSYFGILVIMLKIMVQFNALTGACSKCKKQSQLLSIHLAACCLALYVQAPLLFTSFTFALPSAIVSTPCIAMFRLTGESYDNRRFRKCFLVGCALLSSPPALFLFCEGIITAHKSYWLNLYSPLHLIITLLLIVG